MVTNIPTLLQHRAEQYPDKTAFIFSKDGEIESSRLTFSQLEQHARTIAGVLQDRKVVAGDRVLITCSNPQEYVPVFWGCLFAGAIAVPACSPKNQILFDRVRAIAADAGPKVMIGDQSSWTGGEADLPARGLDIPTISVGEAIQADKIGWHAPLVPPDSVAMLQYTSGSIANPKGVVLQHNHLLNNQRMIQKSFQTDCETVVVSWLPLYHDMGLMGAVVHPVQAGCQCVMMTPEAFLRSPARWLRAISKYRGTVSGGPNFAYELCTRRIAASESEGLDLSSWQTAFNGAESVRPDTLRSFHERFSASGFKSSSFMPCYGLAEATLLVTAASPGREPGILELSRDALARNSVQPASGEIRRVVDCGMSPELEILIVDHQTMQACGPDRVGEIWVGGSSIGSGYWNNPDLSKSIFEARCAGKPGKYLRTGDLGFLRNGSLFVTGRLKGLIVIRGQNYNAEDFETTVSRAHPALAGAVCVVFGTEKAGTEELVVVAEVAARQSLPLDEIATSIRTAIAINHQLPIETVAFVRRGEIPRTSSGKIRRRECQQAFENGDLRLLKRYQQEELSCVQSSAQVEAIKSSYDQEARQLLVLEYLREQVAKAVKVPQETVACDVPLQLGIDSLKSAELQTTVQKDLGVSMPATSFLEGESLEFLAGQIVQRLQSVEQSEMPIDACFHPKKAKEEPLEFPLSLEQERLYLIEQWGKEQGGLNLTAAFRVKGFLDPAELERALNRVIEQHFFLRSRIVEKDGLLIAQADPEKTRCSLKVEALDRPLGDLLDSECRALFKLGEVPLLRARLVGEADTNYLVITLPHIISDASSFGILARELVEFYGKDKGYITAASNPAEYEVLSTAVSRRSNAPDYGYRNQLSYWRQVLSTELPEFKWLQGAPDPSAGGGQTLTFEIASRMTAAVEALARELDCTPFVVFLAAFELLVSQLSRSEDVVVGVPLRTRSSADQSAIGLFAHPVPLRLTVNPRLSFADLAAQTREKILRAMANQDVPFTRIIDLARSGSQRQFLLPVMFTMVEFPTPAGNGIVLQPFAFRFGCGGTEAFLTLRVAEGKVQGVLTYDSRTVPRSRAQLFCDNYISRLEACLEAATQPLHALSAPQFEPADRSQHEAGCTMAVTSTFTADAIEAPLRLWLEGMQLPAACRITPGGEMLQQLLDPRSELSRSCAAFYAHLIRISDLYPSGGQITHGPVRELAEAIKAFSSRSKAPALVCICPSAPSEIASRQSELIEVEQQLKREFTGLPNLAVLTTEDVLAVYPVTGILDPLTDRLAQLPYSREFFAALASMITRRAYMLHHPSVKAIIVDADGTLWDGACSEDGPLGLHIGSAHRELQDFLLTQYKSGCLLCLCSRNRDEDIEAAFASHPEMPLRLEHFVARRVNHSPKSENLRSLAQQLNIALADCLFMDDDPVECAEVRANRPETLVLHVNSSNAVHSLQRVWELDRGTITEEDQHRAAFYQGETARESARREAPSLQAFFDSLQLELKVESLAAEHLPRVSQLTYRTNQFNCTGERFTELQLASLTGQAAPGGAKGLVMHARDRFGDYGLIGALAYRIDVGALHVDWWSLSCRVLNRGVEHRILAYLGKCALAAKVSNLIVSYRDSGKNVRARTFLSCGSTHIPCEDHSSHFVWSAQDASTCELSVVSTEPAPDRELSSAQEKRAKASGSIWNNAVRPNDLLELDASAIVRAAARSQSQPQEPAPQSLNQPDTPTQRRLLRIWADLLGIEHLDVNETLYSAGGQSLVAIQMLSRIQEEFGVELPIMSIFTEDLTVNTLAAAIEDALLARADQAELQGEISELMRLSDNEVSALLASEDI
jgi:FkbH-like protein